jgi:anaerobic magnesium-protoporphyrin IX monomethyl ester cyclase
MNPMNVFLIHVGDDNFSRVLPKELDRSLQDPNRVKVMAFPPLGIQTLAPILRGHGHAVRLFDTCHPAMKPHHLAQAVAEERPDVIGISFLSTTTYPATKTLAERLKSVAPASPIIVGGPFATMNAERILADCLQIDSVGVGEGEELLPDYLSNLDDPGSVAGLVWRNGEEIVENRPRPPLSDLDRFPYPDRRTLPIDYIESLPLDVPAVLSLDKFCTMQTSRGCPYSCIYCDIDPTALTGPEVNRLRMRGYARLFVNRLLKRPRATCKLLRTFGRHMKATDILKLLASPFRRRDLTCRPELPAKLAGRALLEAPVPQPGSFGPADVGQ